MRFLHLLILAVFVYGCTPAIKQNVAENWDGMKTHNYSQTFMQFTGLDQVFKSREQKMRDRERDMCLHEDSERREIHIDGLEDDVYTYRCTLQPYPDQAYIPARLAPRFRK